MDNFIDFELKDTSNKSFDFMIGQDLSNKTFENQCFVGTNFKKSNLSNTVFKKCDLSHANLSYCNLVGAQFDVSNISDINVYKATIDKRLEFLFRLNNIDTKNCVIL